MSANMKQGMKVKIAHPKLLYVLLSFVSLLLLLIWLGNFSFPALFNWSGRTQIETDGNFSKPILNKGYIQLAHHDHGKEDFGFDIGSSEYITDKSQVQIIDDVIGLCKKAKYSYSSSTANQGEYPKQMKLKTNMALVIDCTDNNRNAWGFSIFNAKDLSGREWFESLDAETKKMALQRSVWVSISYGVPVSGE